MDINEKLMNVLNHVSAELTSGHRLHRAHHQAIIDLAFDPLCERLIFLRVLGNMCQQLSKCEAADRESVDEQRAGHKALTVEQLQQPLSMIQTPARPQELLHLACKKTIREKQKAGETSVGFKQFEIRAHPFTEYLYRDYRG